MNKHNIDLNLEFNQELCEYILDLLNGKKIYFSDINTANFICYILKSFDNNPRKIVKNNQNWEIILDLYCGEKLDLNENNCNSIFFANDNNLFVSNFDNLKI
jgi:hypothetical protein